MNSAVIEKRIAQILELLSRRSAVPERGDGVTSHLRHLFDVLAESENPAERAEAEELIWALWCSDEDESATRSLQKATGAMNRGELDQARELLDALIEQRPEWAEAWNKRATVHFLNDDDLASLDDIFATLEREPRHFGAICGFGQICLRHDDELTGRAAFQFALKIHPGLNEVRDAAHALEAKLAPTLH